MSGPTELPLLEAGLNPLLGGWVVLMAIQGPEEEFVSYTVIFKTEDRQEAIDRALDTLVVADYKRLLWVRTIRIKDIPVASQ